AFWPFVPGQSTAGESIAGAQSANYGTGYNLLGRMWDRIGQALLRKPGWIWVASIAAMVPFAALAVRQYNNLNFDLLKKLSSDAPSVVGTKALQQHFPTGITGPVTILVRNDDVDFRSPENAEPIKQVTEQLKERSDELAIADVRSLTQPLGMTEAGQWLVSTG